MAAFAASATEKFDLRYAPGSGGGDLSAPLEAGSYFQLPTFIYRAKITSDPMNVTQGAEELFTGPLAPLAAAFPAANATTAVTSKVKVEANVLLPRWIWMSKHEWLGATVGATAMLPLMQKRLDVTTQVGSTTVSGVDPTALSALTGGALTTDALAAVTNSAVSSGASAQASAFSGSRFGAGDLELAPLLRWSRESQQVIFAPTIVLPTGQYDKNRAVNAGAGNYYTFRPTLQFGHIGDKWDFGARAALSINTKNKDTGYRSGNVLNLDYALMHSLSDQFRAGVNGYAVVQTTRDRSDSVPDASQALTADRKGRVYGIGPGMAWIKGAGDMLLDARLVKEFGAVDRPQGYALWVNLSFPLN
jgi:hypothetical protein